MAIKVRDYKDYDKYIEHQKEKTGDAARRQRLAVNFPIREAHFAYRFRTILERDYPNQTGFAPPHKKSKLVCLGSRMGEEVSAWRKLGFENSIGTDLIARKPYVVVDDFHNLSYDDETVDVFYSNSIDHSNDPAKMFSEVARCLKAGGCFIADFQFGHMGRYEACRIDTIEDAIGLMPDSLNSVVLVSEVESVSNPMTEVIFRKVRTK